MRAKTIPEIAGPTPRAPSTRMPKRKQAIPGSRQHILLVDDELLVVQASKELLELWGYRVTTRANGLDALETVRRQPESFHLVLTDFAMPLMNGLELARELWRLRPALPVILITGCGQDLSPVKARELGLADFLTKPVRAAALRRAIRRALDAAAAGEEPSGAV